MKNAVDFIRVNTRLMSPPLVPEIKLHLAAETLPIWQKTEEQLGAMNVPPPYWAFAWAGGQALSRFILDTPLLMAGRRVLDLGSGSGISAIAAVKAGAASVLANDIDALSATAIAMNAEANGVHLATSSADLLANPLGPFDTILVGDLFYERTLANRVLNFIEAAGAVGVTVFVGDPQRNYFPSGRFAAAASYNVPVTRDLEDSDIKPTTVWRLSTEAIRG